MKVPQKVVDIFAQIPEDIFNDNVVVFVDCRHRGMNFRIQTGGNSTYIKRPPLRGWKRYAGALKDIVRKITGKQDEKLGRELDDQEKNEELAESFARFLDCFDDKGRGDPRHRRWTIGRTHVEMYTKNNKFVVHGKNKKTSEIRPAIAIDRLLNCEPGTIIKMMATDELDGDEEAYKRMLKCIKRRDEREEDAQKIELILDKLARQEPSYDRHLKRWRVAHVVVDYDTYAHKFKVKGEWMLPFQALDKVATLVPKVAKQVADPNIL
jgi:hypothetical protein